MPLSLAVVEVNDFSGACGGVFSHLLIMWLLELVVRYLRDAMPLEGVNAGGRTHAFAMNLKSWSSEHLTHLVLT